MSRAGQPVTVMITPTTQFGTKAQPGPASQFVPGSQIAAIGTRNGTTVIATRGLVPAAATTSSSTTAPANASTGAGRPRR